VAAAPLETLPPAAAPPVAAPVISAPEVLVVPEVLALPAVEAAPAVVGAVPPVAAAPPVPTNGLRSMADAHKDRDSTMKGVDMCCLPVGPYQSEEQLVEAVQAWAGNSATNGGAFAIPPKKESRVADFGQN
jgi:hypothetical protein